MTRVRVFGVLIAILGLGFLLSSCSTAKDDQAAQRSLPDDRAEMVEVLLGSGKYPAIAYSGHRKVPRAPENTPTVAETKEDLRILAAMGIKLLRTYNTTLYPHSERILRAIEELRQEDPGFEMYVMLGAWIQCYDPYGEDIDHTREDEDTNRLEIEAALRLAAAHPEVVRIIGVGNEATVTWQAHFVPAWTILKYVNVVREARDAGRLPESLLVTTSDNWAALGGEESYHNPDLVALLEAIDFLSLHTYAFHDTYYNPALQWASPGEADLPAEEQAALAVERAIEHQKSQFAAVKAFLAEIGVEKKIRIGETGWASLDNSFYGDDGTCAASEFNAKLFYDATMKWVRENNLTCFYFEAFDEPWKSGGTAGSEGHFGLFTVDGQAKYALWDLVDAGVFEGLTRGGKPIVKTHGGDESVVKGRLKAPREYRFKP